MSKPAIPQTPDYTGAAQQQGQNSRENTLLSASLNRPDVITPLGSQTWEMTGPDKYTQHINLSDSGQQLFDSQNQLAQKESTTANTLFDQSQTSLSQPLDLTKVGGSQQDIQDALYRRSTAMLDPQFKQQEESERDRLANQGFQVGNAGYDRAIGNFDRAKMAAYGDARDRAIIGGQDARKQAIQEALLQRQAPLNELNALRTGSQVTQPQFQATSAVGTPETTQYLAATNMLGQDLQDIYGVQTGTRNAKINALGNIGGALAKSGSS